MTYKTNAEYREEAPSKGELALEAATDKAYASRWWESHDNLALTALWMATEGGFEAREIAYFVEKPWKFTTEFVLAQALADEDGIEAWVDTTPPGDSEPEYLGDGFMDEDLFRGDR
jgi:hypothetical protein